mgnify:CR=1 FL=1
MSSLAKNYKRRNLSFSKGKGSFLYSKRGVKFLDFVQGIAVNSLGHANPILVKTIHKQSKKLWHVSNAFQIPEGEKLAKKICKRTFADFVMTGRPFIIGLAALGDKGANHVHDILKDELANVMEQVCAKNIEELKSEDVVLEDDFTLNNFKLSS